MTSVNKIRTHLRRALVGTRARVREKRLTTRKTGKESARIKAKARRKMQIQPMMAYVVDCFQILSF
jgi:hypothetical protein